MADKKLQIVIDAKNNAAREFSNLKSQIKGISNSFSFEMGLISKASKLATAGIAGVSAGMIYLGKQAIDNASDFEQNRIAFEGMFASAEKASKLMEDIVKSAKKTPFELQDLVSGAKQLAAYKVEVEKVVPTLEMLGDIASVVGTDKLPVLIRAFGQIKAKTKLMGGELLQLTETGIPIIEELAKVTGHSAEEIANDTADLGISFEEVEQALKNMTEEGGFAYKAMELQSKTLSGVISNLSDNFTTLGIEIVGVSKTGEIIQGGLFDIVKQGANNLLQLIENNKEAIKDFATNAIQNMINKIKEWYESIGGAEGLKSKLTELWETIKNDVIPTIKSLGQTILEIAKFILEHKDLIIKLYLAYLGIKTALVINGVISSVYSFAKAIQVARLASFLLSASFGWVSLIAGAVALVWKITDGFKDWSKVTGVLKGALKLLMKPIESIVELFDNWAYYMGVVKNLMRETADKVGLFLGLKNYKVSKRATGGSVTSGKPYIVGERSAEVFIPSTSGRIEKDFSKAMQPAWATGTINVNINGGMYLDRNSGEQLAEVISEALRRKLRI